MSNLEAAPPLIARRGRDSVSAGPARELIPGRVASLGNGTAVRRLLPTLGRRMVGAWCFFDHYGPDDVTQTTGMDVAPHPHTGLQTVSWLLAGEVQHRDSLGNDIRIRPGDLGLMTAGHGVAHSEQSPVPHPDLLHGAQLWVALPDHARDGEPRFEHHSSVPETTVGAAVVRVVLGEFHGLRSPGRVHTPLVGLDVDVHGESTLDLEPDFEYAAVCVLGEVEIDGFTVPLGSTLYLGAGNRNLRIGGAGRLMLLGGEPFAEKIVMWWNLLGRSHDEIANFRADWDERGTRFTDVPGWAGARLASPPFPPVGSGRVVPMVDRRGTRGDRRVR